MDRQFRLARVWSNEELRKIGWLFDGKVVNVSAGENVDKEGSTYNTYFPHAGGFWITNYRPGAYRGFQGRPNELMLDLSSLIAPELEGAFDVVFNHTTLEHVFEVKTAFSNLCRLSTDVVIIVVPFAQVQHENEGYQDYWRFTPTCIRQLFQGNGLEVIYESASPYSNAAVYLFFVATRYPDRWRLRMPSYTVLGELGSWIGARPKGFRGWIGELSEWAAGLFGRRDT